MNIYSSKRLKDVCYTTVFRTQLSQTRYIHSFIYSAEFKMLCNTLGLRCWRGWSFRSENGTPIVDRYQNGSPTGLVEITHVIKGK